MMQANNFCPAGKKSFTKERLSGKEDAVQGTVQEIKSCHDVSFRVMFLPAAGVAQLAEQLICNQQVAGSTPIASSIFPGLAGWDDISRKVIPGILQEARFSCRMRQG